MSLRCVRTEVRGDAIALPGSAPIQQGKHQQAKHQQAKHQQGKHQQAKHQQGKHQRTKHQQAKQLNPLHLRRAAAVLRAGGVIAYPTEAVYGLGCDPLNPEAVMRLLRLKRRAVQKGLILISAEADQLDPWIVYPSAAARRRALRTWPGALTWIVAPRPLRTPSWLRGRHRGLAVRVTAHPPAAALCRLCGPLISTSANPAGRSAALDATAVRHYFRRRLDYILVGPTGGLAGPSELRELRSGRVLRRATPSPSLSR